MPSALYRIRSGLSIDDNVYILEGAGSPEGSISAPVGSLYSDTSNAQLYYKSSGGTGNTGWVYIQLSAYAETPWKYYSGSQLAIIKDAATTIDTISDVTTDKIAVVKWEVLITDASDETNRYTSTVKALVDEVASGNVDFVEYGTLTLDNGSPIENVEFSVAVDGSSNLTLDATITTTGTNNANAYFYRSYLKR